MSDWTEQGAVPVDDRPTADELAAHQREQAARERDAAAREAETGERAPGPDTSVGRGGS